MGETTCLSLTSALQQSRMRLITIASLVGVGGLSHSTSRPVSANVWAPLNLPVTHEYSGRTEHVAIPPQKTSESNGGSEEKGAELRVGQSQWLRPAAVLFIIFIQLPQHPSLRVAPWLLAGRQIAAAASPLWSPKIQMSAESAYSGMAPIRGEDNHSLKCIRTSAVECPFVFIPSQITITAAARLYVV